MLNALSTKFYLNVVSFFKDQRGVTAIEYAIIGVAMSAIVLSVFNSGLSTALNGAMSSIDANISSAGSSSGASGS
ncbi:Flp family type IVb pilin [Vibrio tritonius]|uniref:Flp family type IVb pilin n=1 Tax=Vibrio tritonius TaxID=1435069 RepID=A0ABS7YHK7_9VIBR|nr:Flp family type IVb pilin [Vibrio tritonius]MCA2015166.1 Flp family type IVb pilin [Vibrio tritonius]